MVLFKGLFYYKGRRKCDFIVKEGTRPKAAIEEGFILTNDEEREQTFEGAKIRIMPVWKWLRSFN
jgi:predicted AAA+ superfamily ATPase